MITFGRTADLSEADRASIRAVSEAVYPPDEIAGPSKSVEWARPEWIVRVHADGDLVSCVGVVIRDGMHEDKPARIGGIGGVMTHPAGRRKGHAEAGIKRAVEFFREQEVAFGLLVCRPHLLEYYGRHGWQRFDGELLVRQQGERTVFVINRVMTLAVLGDAPTTGTVDLCGPPW
jgi:aminoglycoside 2'-N-acetyltransferase I